jgi:WD40 repeat protein
MRTAITILAVVGAFLVGTSIYHLQASHVQTPNAKTESGDILYTGDAQGQITQWSISQQKQTRKLLSPHTTLITSLLVTSDGKHMVSVDQFGGMYKWDVATGNWTSAIVDVTTNNDFSACALTKDGNSLFCGGFPGKIKSFSMQTNKLALDMGQVFDDLNPQVHKPMSAIWTMATTPDNKSLFAANEYGHLKQFSVKDGSLLKDYGVVHSDSLSSLTITNDGKWLFTSSISGEFKKWDVSKQSLVKDFGKIYPKENNWIFAITSSPDSKNVFVSSSNWTIGVMSQWSAADEKMVRDYGTVFDTHSFRSLVVTRDGKFVFTASDQGNLKQYGVADGALVKDYGAVGKEESLSYGIYTMAVA